MTEISFKGKEFVYNHHLSVPFRPLEMHADKGIGDPRLDGNLIIQGDNLHALKALLPLYAGKVDCIFIDPPYNTGNEGWAYNDNVNAPMIKAWMEDNPIGIEDGLRHDKWCAMMWPRLKLLWDLLDETGSLWITVDDNEAHRCHQMCCEIFGEANFVATFIWRKVDSPNDNKVSVTPDHDFVLCFAKDKSQLNFSRKYDPSILNSFSKRDEEGRLFRDRLLKKNGRNSLRTDRPTMYFPLEGPDGIEVYPTHEDGTEARWAAGEKTVQRHDDQGTLIWKQIKKMGVKVWEPYTREFANEDEPYRPYPTIWNDVDTMRQAKSSLKKIFGSSEVFDTPKTVKLIDRILKITNTFDGIVLDSFAGSGTTAHAVLEANKKDGGNRRFILCEMEDYADELTAERVRRVINGYDFTGTQKTELMRDKLTVSKLRNADALIKEMEAIENLHGHEYGKIKSTVKDSELIVTAETKVAERTKGLGGKFTYCTLGKAIALDDILTGEALPDYAALGSVLFHMATNLPLESDAVDEATHYLGETDGQKVWLIYRPDLDWLQSPDAALTLSFARKLTSDHPDTKHLVFAPARYVSQKMLKAENLAVDFAPLPYALYRVERE